jgi:hypothetical protein
LGTSSVGRSPSSGKNWQRIVSATSLEEPPARHIATGVISSVLPRLDSRNATLPLASAASVGWRFIRTVKTKGSLEAAQEIGLPIESGSQYDTISDLLWRTVVAASTRTAYTPIAQLSEIAFKRVLNRIVFSTEKLDDKELTKAFLEYVKERGSEGFVRELFTEYLNEFVLTYLRTENRNRDLNGSAAFHRVGERWRSREEEERLRESLRDACSSLSEELSRDLKSRKFFQLLESEPSEKNLQALAKSMQKAFVKKFLEGGRD